MSTMILAIGNAGGNIVEALRRDMKHTELKDARYVFADCNIEDLKNHVTDECLIMPLDHDQTEFPSENFKEIDRLYIVTGLGGVTGTKFAELTARCAVAAGVKTVAVIATLPFILEGEKRLDRAVSAARRINDIQGVNIFCLKNEDLHIKYPDMDFFKTFAMVDKEVMELLEQLLVNGKPVTSYSVPQPRIVEISPKKMYVFSTYKRFTSEIQKNLKELLSDEYVVIIYLFNCVGLNNSTFMKAALGLQLRQQVNIITIDREFDPPIVNNGDTVIDAIASDPSLQPLKGGFLALEQWITNQDATIHKI